MIICYVAAKFSGKTRAEVEDNIAAAVVLGIEVAKVGVCPLVPHANTAHPEYERVRDYTFWIAATMELLRRCDVILMHQNWQQSSGARGEHEEAKRRGMPVFYSVDELKAWLDERSAA